MAFDNRYDCTMDFRGTPVSDEWVAQKLREKPPERLRVVLGRDVEVDAWPLVCEELKNVENLERVGIEGRGCPRSPVAFFDALGRNSRIRSLTLWGVKVSSDVSLSTSLTDLTLYRCSVVDESACDVLTSIIRANKLKNLTLRYISIPLSLESPKNPREFFKDVGAAIEETLRRPDSALRRLTLAHSAIDYGSASMLGAVACSQLDFFACTAWTFDNLGEFIPKLQLTELEILDEAFTESMNSRLLEALKKNISLQRVKVREPRSRGRIGQVHYCERYRPRNRALADWIENPLSVPRCLWPHYTKLAASGGQATSLHQSIKSQMKADFLEGEGTADQHQLKKKAKLS